jgi:hypothetical protein
MPEASGSATGTDDAAAAAAAAADAANAGSPGDGDGNAGANADQGSNGGANANTEPFSGLQDEGSRKWLNDNGIKDVLGLVKKAVETDKLIGNSVRVPGKDATPEDWEKFFARLPDDRRAPPSADGYEFAPPANMPEDVPYSNEFAEWFKAAAHKAGVSKGQAKALHDEFVGMSIATTQASTEARQEAGLKALEETWGPSTEGRFKANVEFADKGIKALGGDKLMASLKANGLLGKNGEVLDPVIATAFAAAGQQFGAEGELVLSGQSGGHAGPNPWAEGAENLTAQSKLVKTDPALAASLITAAGKQPSDYGLKS